MEVKNLLLKEVVVSEFNPRKHCDEGRFSELLASIKDKGILVPIRVRPVGKNRYEIVGGERRFKAASTLGLKEIPAVVQELSDSEALEFAIIDNLQREDVHPMEEAEGYEILKEKHGYKNVV
ncbi:MAG: ParB/RepB/Spo0J family partition protein, partial [Candidatus Omnitrophota bacterium]